MTRLLRAVAGYLVLIGCVATLYEQTNVLLAAMVAESVVVLVMMRTREATLAWLVGAVLGPVGESIAVWRGAWSYWGTDGLPIWLPPAWGLASLLLMEIVLGLQGRRSEP